MLLGLGAIPSGVVFLSALWEQDDDGSDGSDENGGVGGLVSEKGPDKEVLKEMLADPVLWHRLIGTGILGLLHA